MSFPLIFERSTAVYRATIGDELEVPISGASLTTLTVTVYDLTTGNIVNGRNNQDVLNKKGVTVDAAGRLAWQLDPADTGLVSQTNLQEIRVALFTWTWGDPVKTGRYEVRFTIKNLNKVT